MSLSLYHRKYGIYPVAELKSGEVYFVLVQLTKNKLGLNKCISTSLSSRFALYGAQKCHLQVVAISISFTENLKVVENLKTYGKTIEAKSFKASI